MKKQTVQVEFQQTAGADDTLAEAKRRAEERHPGLNALSAAFVGGHDEGPFWDQRHYVIIDVVCEPKA